MYTHGKFDFGNETDPATWYDTAIGLCKGKLEMRRFDVLSHLRAQLREEFRNDIICRESVRVLRREILFANNPARVDIEESGVGHSFGHSFRFCVKHVEMANDFGVGVRQQGKLDFVPLGEILQDRGTIVADGGQL